VIYFSRQGISSDYKIASQKRASHCCVFLNRYINIPVKLNLAILKKLMFLSIIFSTKTLFGKIKMELLSSFSWHSL
jgi:hypothetical protein